jgi:hypothetical protein
MKLAFVCRLDNPYLCDKRPQINFRKFYLEALPRIEGVDVTILSSNGTLDLAPMANKFDAWLFFDAVEWGIPPDLRGVDKIKGPKVCMIGDCHGAETRSEAYGMTKRECCEMWGFDAYFFQHTPDYFYRFFPANWEYWWIPFGVDAALYHEVRPWWSRRRDKVLLTGVLGPEYYPLRTHLAKQQRFVQYYPPGSYSGMDSYAPGQFDGDKYKLLLAGWQGAIASGYSVLCKYFEIPAAGCLTFAHVDDVNGCDLIGFEDGETAVLIDRDNAEAKIAEFLETADDPKWRGIANAGRRYVLDRFTHDKMAAELVDKIKGLC